MEGTIYIQRMTAKRAWFQPCGQFLKKNESKHEFLLLKVVSVLSPSGCMT